MRKANSLYLFPRHAISYICYPDTQFCEINTKVKTVTKRQHQKEVKLSSFPAFFKVAGRMVVVVGEGEEALAKCRLVAKTYAEIRLFAAAPSPELQDFAAQNTIELCNEDVTSEAIEGAALVFAATGDHAQDRAIVALARDLRIPANAVDQPDQCDFYTPALVTRAPVAIAIGTEGAGPVLAQMIRARIDQMLPVNLGRVALLAQSYRRAADVLLQRGGPRRAFWKNFFSGSPARHAEGGDLSQARRAATRLLRSGGVDQGHVSLVGAGPGAEDLLTLRAQRLLMEADVIVYDALVPEAVVAMGRRDAVRIPVGKRKGCHSKSQKEIDQLLVSLGRDGKRVVRLKSGDPLIFGRAAEELTALRSANISHEVVPGVTSAFAAAADFALPLTVRGTASSLVFTTGHDLKGDALPDWANLAIGGATVAVYMGRTVAADVAKRLIEIGLPGDTPVAAVENASRTDARFFHGTLHDLPVLAKMDELNGPVMVIIGEAVAGADLTRATALARLNTQVAAQISARYEESLR
jgi:uroporphyrin-III C-methyltransferase / precorrin-2 dehydrogenase / sirohydrochlorin ferrochelatase